MRLAGSSGILVHMIFLLPVYAFPAPTPERADVVSPERYDAPITGVVLSRGQTPEIVFGPDSGEELVRIRYDFPTTYEVLGPPHETWQPNTQYRLAADIESSLGMIFTTGAGLFPAPTLMESCIRWPSSPWVLEVTSSGDPWGWIDVVADGRPVGFMFADEGILTVRSAADCMTVRAFHADGRVSATHQLCPGDSTARLCEGVSRPVVDEAKGCSTSVGRWAWMSALARR